MNFPLVFRFRYEHQKRENVRRQSIIDNMARRQTELLNKIIKLEADLDKANNNDGRDPVSGRYTGDAG